MRLPTASYNQPGRNSSRLVNAYAQASVGKTPVDVLGAPGITTLCLPSYASEVTTGRALFQMKGNLYAVIGQSFFTVATDGTYTRIGEIPGTTPVMLAGLASQGDDSLTQIVTDTGYIYDGTTVDHIADPDLTDWSSVDFIDGYIVFTVASTGEWGCTALLDASSIDPLDFATAEGNVDNAVRLIVDHRQVLVFGAETTEINWNSGQTGFPFERLSGGFVELGLLARFGAVKADNSVFWLASDKTIRRLTGSTPVRVSKHAVEEAIASYGSVVDCEASSYTWEGHIFVVFRFPSAFGDGLGACWVYDVTTGEWHERESYGSSGWNIRSVVMLDGRAYCLSDDGKIGYFDDTVHTEFGNPMHRQVTFPIVYAKSGRMFHSQFDAVFRTGDAPSGVVPTVSLEISEDGGSTWRAMIDKPLGEIGEYRKVVRWTRLGSARDRVYRLTCASAVPFLLTDAQLEVAAGAK